MLTVSQINRVIVSAGKCGFCYGTGIVDSCGSEGNGRWIDVMCDNCNGSGYEEPPLLKVEEDIGLFILTRRDHV